MPRSRWRSPRSATPLSAWTPARPRFCGHRRGRRARTHARRRSHRPTSPASWLPPGSEGRFSTILDSGLFHALPPDQPPGLCAIHLSGRRAGSLAVHPGLRRRGTGRRPFGTGRARRGFTETELHDAVATLWRRRRRSRGEALRQTTAAGRRTLRWHTWNTTTRATSWRPGSC